MIVLAMKWFRIRGWGNVQRNSAACGGSLRKQVIDIYLPETARLSLQD